MKNIFQFEVDVKRMKNVKLLLLVGAKIDDCIYGRRYSAEVVEIKFIFNLINQKIVGHIICTIKL